MGGEMQYDRFALIELGARAAWAENCREWAELFPEKEALSLGWDQETEGLRMSWRRYIGAALDAAYPPGHSGSP